MLLAFVAGLLLFLLVLSLGRNRGTESGSASLPTAASPQYAPLPAPLPAAGADGASRLAKPPGANTADGDEQPRLVETRPPAPPPTLPQPAPAATASTATSRPEPVPGQTPSPRYPAQALRRGESGTVNVRVEIGPDGVPAQVSVEGSSGSRHLDRAAVDAVRRWHFRPATSNGQPVSGSVIVPIRFDAQG
ncbi:energy transducer TonB [Lysobacter sp. S4-A87]|uniref:energy transducer TonB n=1 Tax=Lysobacter sp. S4-A87 TaxID=2925843 RepID=UPI001F53D951|nr:energy transducer TonB [Lysobacter sp. S4-A87]UNK49687.1 energy transducer TonB [Lysobacter sp. S4-A87]